MKRLLLLSLTLLLLGGAAVRAQDVGNSRHTVFATIGGPPGWANYMNNHEGYYYDYGGDLKSMYSPTLEYSYGASFQIGYAYRLGKEIRIGADLGYGFLTATETSGRVLPRKETREMSQQLFSVVPVVEWTYDTGKRYSAYFRAGLGAEFSYGELENKINPAWELVLVGLRFGKRFYFLCELGAGSEYVARAGVG